MSRYRKALLCALAALSSSAVLAQSPGTAQTNDPWVALRPLEGRWRGDAQGEPGKGTSTREYRFVLGDKFMHGDNTAIYPPQEKNPKGETHKDMSIYSYDKAAKALVLRQFNIEGFVNTYAQERMPNADELRFVSTSIENIPAGFRARETYRFVGPDEVTEVFEIAEPGKDFAVYSETRLKRVK